MVQLSVLGPLEVTVDGRPVAVAGALLRRLLVRLAVDAGAPVGHSDLASAIWPVDRPTDEANALQSLISRLRRVLGDGALVQQVPGGYRLATERSAVDLHCCAELAALGRRQLAAGDATAAWASLSRARDLFRGAPLFDAGDADYADQVISRVLEMRLEIVTDLCDAQLQLGRGNEVVTELEALVGADLLRERSTALLMTALAGAGRTAEALAAYERLRAHLVEELGVDPSPELQRLHLALLRGDLVGAPPTAPLTAPVKSNVRSFLTSFVGREVELDRVTRLLRDHRLSTIVGPGGAGKTRLAAQAATVAASSAPDGVWMVELAPVTEESGITMAILDALGSRSAKVLERVGERTAIDATDRLFDLLERSDCLLIMDNCEHLLGATAVLVDRILAQCSAVRVLATSREPLGIVGEALCLIPPLGLPPDGGSVQEALGYPSVQLLVDRAAASTEFTVDELTVAPVIEIVRRLDGLPLAIELAAARLRVLPIAEIAVRLSDRFRLLSGGNRAALPRHRTLRAVVEWSWDLLSPTERLLAERLSVFPAGTTPASATMVCADAAIPAEDVPDLLLSLADKSLLQITGDSGLRYRMLETIREFGVERLSDRGQLDAARVAHARYFADLTERLDPVLRTSAQLDAIAALGAERENILAALRYLGDSADPDRAIKLALTLNWYWTLIGAHSEALTWTEFTLAASEGSEHPDRIFLEAFRVIMSLAGGRQDPTRTGDDPMGWAQWRDALLSMSKRLDQVPINWAQPLDVVLRPMLAFFSGDSARGTELTVAAMASTDPWIRAAVQVMRAAFAENMGDTETMRTCVSIAYEEFLAIGDRWGLAAVLGNRSVLRTLDGDLAGAVADLEQALHYTTEIGSSDDDLMIHLKLADLKLRIGDSAAAKQHLTAATDGGAGRPIGAEREMLIHAALASIAQLEGRREEAMELVKELRRGLSGTGATMALRGHLAAIVSSISAVISIENGDIDAARADLVDGFREAVGTMDQPIVAGTGVAIAVLADATGQHEDAAVILGAAAALRGGDDRTDLRIIRITAKLREVLGDDFEDFYAKGKAMGRDEALGILDPAPGRSSSVAP